MPHIHFGGYPNWVPNPPYFIPHRAGPLIDASRVHNQNFKEQGWAIFCKTRPVKIIAGHSPSRLYVQFYDRPDTPIRLVAAKDVETGEIFKKAKPGYQPKTTKARENYVEVENLDAFEEGWW